MLKPGIPQLESHLFDVKLGPSSNVQEIQYIKLYQLFYHKFGRNWCWLCQSRAGLLHKMRGYRAPLCLVGEEGKSSHPEETFVHGLLFPHPCLTTVRTRRGDEMALIISVLPVVPGTLYTGKPHLTQNGDSDARCRSSVLLGYFLWSVYISVTSAGFTRPF